MNNELTFRVIFATLYILFTSIRAYYMRKNRLFGRQTPTQKRLKKVPAWERLKEVAEREGKLNFSLRVITSPFYFAGVILYPIYPPWVAQFTLPLPIWLRWIGISLGLISLPLLIWIHHTLGKYWSSILELREEHTLVTSGPYRWVRHPLYTLLIGL